MRLGGRATPTDIAASICWERNLVNAHLKRLKEVDEDTPNEGQTITYTITAANSAESNAPATNVMVFDNLPAGITFVSADPSSGRVRETSVRTVAYRTGQRGEC